MHARSHEEKMVHNLTIKGCKARTVESCRLFEIFDILYLNQFVNFVGCGVNVPPIEFWISHF